MHELPWLLTPPSDFNDRCAALVDSGSLSSDIRALAGYSLTINQSNRLYRTIKKLGDVASGALLKELSGLKLGIVSNSTLDLLVPSMVTSAIRHGVFLDVVTADFDQVAQEAFDPNSMLNQAGLDIVLLALDYRAFPFAANTLATTVENLKASDALEYLNQVREAFNRNSGVNCIVQTMVPPPYSLMGNIDAQVDGLLRKEISDFNSALINIVHKDADILLDVAALASNVGVYNWFDERQWYLSRVPMANVFIPLYTDRIASILGAVRGKSKKCLVLDLDNTIWGGVIGDDGLEGILIGQGNPRGESYLALQQLALELKKHGVILAVCSKNDEQNARQPFREHPDMLLKEDDISVFVANWEDKASNIRYIAETLNIGLDSLVFVDDNAAEREIVRMRVPEVTVPELPKDAALYPRTLAAANYFEMISFTTEDSQRAGQYTQNAKRRELSQSSENIDDFLTSLDMEMTISPFDELGRKRIVQLINKTNQFNLTTQRYTETEVEQFEKSSDVFTMQIRLSDRFGDNGMISALICRQIDKQWEIDSWLMSCRVIKRRVEEAVCDELVQLALKHNIEKIKGVFIPSPKNSLVKTHYQQLGFELEATKGEAEIWVLGTSEYEMKKPPIKISR